MLLSVGSVKALPAAVSGALLVVFKWARRATVKQ